jgi:hypothetical protein
MANGSFGDWDESDEDGGGKPVFAAVVRRIGVLFHSFFPPITLLLVDGNPPRLSPSVIEELEEILREAGTGEKHAL